MAGKRKYIQGYDPELVKAVTFYHECHRDGHAEPHGWFCDPCGYALLLVRLTNEQGEQMSVMDEAFFSAQPDMQEWEMWDIKEIYSCSRKDEHEMVQRYVGGKGDTDGQEDED